MVTSLGLSVVVALLGDGLGWVTHGLPDHAPFLLLPLECGYPETLLKSLLSDRLYLALSSASTNHKTLASVQSVLAVANTFLLISSSAWPLVRLSRTMLWV